MTGLVYAQQKRNLMSIDELNFHPFVTVVFGDAMKVQRVAGIEPFSIPSETLLLNETQFYITRVAYSLSHLLTWIEQLHHAVIFLASFNYERRTKEAGVNRFHHLIYNVENYLVRLQSVYDRLLQLTNNVFHICTSAELVSHNLIVSNLHVTRTTVPKMLKAVRKTIEPKATTRNEIVHRHSYSDPLFRRLELFYMQTEASWSNTAKKSDFKNLAQVRAQMMKEATTKKRTEFELINSELVKTMVPLFSDFLTYYQKYRDRIERADA